MRNSYDDVITITRSASAIKVADETGRTYTLALNASGRVTKVTDPVGGVITYTYNASGNLTGQYKNYSQTPFVTYTYNDDGDLTEKTDTDAGLQQHTDGYVGNKNVIFNSLFRIKM